MGALYVRVGPVTMNSLEKNASASWPVSTNGVAAEIEALRERIAQLEVELRSAKQRNSTAPRPSNTQLWQLIDLALHAMVLVDRNGQILKVNAQAEKLFGYPAEELVGELIEILVPEAFRDGHPAQRDGYFADPQVKPIGIGRNLFGRRKDGTQIPIEIGLSPIETEQGAAVIASILDISQRKLAEEKFRLAVESSPSAVIMVNADGNIVLVNVQTERMFGYQRAELIGQPVELLVPDRFRGSHPMERQDFFATPAARPMGAGRDLRGRRRDGSEFPVEIGLTPIETDDGLLVMSAIVDITERIQSEKRARLHLAELAHAARLSAVGEMFSELAHEINQPLGAAANYTRACVRLLKTGEPLSTDQLQQWLEKAAVQAVRATEIVQRIGSYVRRGGPVQANLDINEVIQHVVLLPVLDVWAAGMVHRVVPELRLERDLPPLMADRVQIEQVLLNLIRNAMDAMAELPASDRRIVIKTARDGGFIRVSVADNGSGLSPDHLAHVFTPFFTTKSNGMGLGLSISKSIIEAHSGTLTVQSQRGVGTKFTFTLPTSKSEERS